MPDSRTFGNTLRSIRGFFVFLAILATILAVAFYLNDQIHATKVARVANSVAMALAISALPLVAVLPTCLFAIRIENGVISHLFLRRFALSIKPVSDLEAVSIARGLGAVLEFKDGSKIRFLGAHLEELREMSRYLESLRAGQVSQSTGVAAAALFAIADKFKRDA